MSASFLMRFEEIGIFFRSCSKLSKFFIAFADFQSERHFFLFQSAFLWNFELWTRFHQNAICLHATPSLCRSFLIYLPSKAQHLIEVMPFSRRRWSKAIDVGAESTDALWKAHKSCIKQTALVGCRSLIALIENRWKLNGKRLFGCGQCLFDSLARNGKVFPETADTRHNFRDIETSQADFIFNSATITP